MAGNSSGSSSTDPQSGGPGTWASFLGAAVDDNAQSSTIQYRPGQTVLVYHCNVLHKAQVLQVLVSQKCLRRSQQQLMGPLSSSLLADDEEVSFVYQVHCSGGNCPLDRCVSAEEILPFSEDGLAQAQERTVASSISEAMKSIVRQKKPNKTTGRK